LHRNKSKKLILYFTKLIGTVEMAVRVLANEDSYLPWKKHKVVFLGDSLS
jgi:hypothetical protein